MKYFETGFAFIGFGIMILCICHGCTQCERVRVETRTEQK